MTSPIYTALYDAIDAAMDDVADMDTTRQDYARAATEAAMKACGPRELVWYPSPEDICEELSQAGGVTYAVGKYHEVDKFYWGFFRAVDLPDVDADTLEAAKAAAQSNADAAHWANTVIGSEVRNG